MHNTIKPAIHSNSMFVIPYRWVLKKYIPSIQTIIYSYNHSIFPI